MDPVTKYIMSFIGSENDGLSRIAGQGEELENIQPSIGEEAGRFLALLVRALQAKRVLELGTSLGYSTVWLGQALRDTAGTLTTIERNEDLFRKAVANVAAAGLSDIVKLIHGDASSVLDGLGGPYDIILQDCDKALYPVLMDRCVELTRRHGVIVADDALFKPKGIEAKFSDPIDEYNRLVFADPRLYSTILPIGDGITLSVRLQDK
jgi:predicted O-methyltransferase YrrM